MNKESITRIVYEQLPNDNPFKEHNQQQLQFLWWTTGRSSPSLRLSEEGKTAFDLAGIVYYDYPLILSKEQKETFNNRKFALELSKKINCPYYVGLKTQNKNSAYIRVYDGKVAVLISLYGNIWDYLQSK